MTRTSRFGSNRSVGFASAAVLVCGLVMTMAATAQVAPASRPVSSVGGPAWATLTAQQQSALAPLKRDWQDIDPPRKQKWLEIAARFPAMPAEERQRVQERMTEWARMTPDERGRARLQFQEARQISPQDRQARWNAYLALPADERKALARSAGTVPDAAASAGKAPAAAAPQNQSQKAVAANAPPAQAAPKSIAPTVVQAKPGASTTLISKMATPPPHAQAGMPRIDATQGVVDRRTLLPQAGPQGVAAAPPAVPPVAPGSATR